MSYHERRSYAKHPSLIILFNGSGTTLSGNGSFLESVHKNEDVLLTLELHLWLNLSPVSVSIHFFTENSFVYFFFSYSTVKTTIPDNIFKSLIIKNLHGYNKETIKIFVMLLSFWWGKVKWMNTVQRGKEAASIKTEIGVYFNFNFFFFFNFFKCLC